MRPVLFLVVPAESEYAHHRVPQGYQAIQHVRHCYCEGPATQPKLNLEIAMKKQTGFTLIEIMISLLLGLIVLGATISIYIAAIRGSSDVIKSARLNYDLDSALSMMANDIRQFADFG